MATKSKFKPMLAATIEHEGQLKFPLYASPKIDGIRALATAQGLLSRTLKPLPNQLLQQTYLDIILACPELIGTDLEVTIKPNPGEGNSYNEVQSAVMSADIKSEFALNIFDIYSYPDFVYSKRYQILRSTIKQDLTLYSGPHNFWVKLVPQVIVNSMAHLLEYEQYQLSLGYEGVMVRVPNSPYKYGRSTVRQLYLGKVKQFKDDEAIVVGFEEQMANNNKPTQNALGYQERSHHQANKVGKNTLGALIATHPTFGQISIGTGFNDVIRKLIWDNQDTYLGKLVKFKYFEVGIKDKPRFPVFISFRDGIDL